jgi:membrane-anchored protein YejM (alkaline phosphatase superfamily)
MTIIRFPKAVRVPPATIEELCEQIKQCTEPSHLITLLSELDYDLSIYVSTLFDKAYKAGVTRNLTKE